MIRSPRRLPAVATALPGPAAVVVVVLSVAIGAALSVARHDEWVISSTSIADWLAAPAVVAAGAAAGLAAWITSSLSVGLLGHLARRQHRSRALLLRATATAGVAGLLSYVIVVAGAWAWAYSAGFRGSPPLVHMLPHVAVVLAGAAGGAALGWIAQDRRSSPVATIVVLLVVVVGLPRLPHATGELLRSPIGSGLAARPGFDLLVTLLIVVLGAGALLSVGRWGRWIAVGAVGIVIALAQVAGTENRFDFDRTAATCVRSGATTVCGHPDRRRWLGDYAAKLDRAAGRFYAAAAPPVRQPARWTESDGDRGDAGTSPLVRDVGRPATTNVLNDLLASVARCDPAVVDAASSSGDVDRLFDRAGAVIDGAPVARSGRGAERDRAAFRALWRCGS